MHRTTARITAVCICAALLAATVYGASRLRQAQDLARRRDYAGARRIVAADTSSLSGAELAEAVLVLARLETKTAAAEPLYRRIMAAGPGASAARAALDLAKIAYARGEYRDAVTLLSADRGGLDGREAAEAVYFRGLAYKQLGESSRASAELAQVPRGPYFSWSLIARAEIEAQAERLPAAIGLYERALAVEGHPVARFGLAECRERAGERDRALETYRSIAKDFPRSLEAAQATEKIRLLAQSRGAPAAESAPKGGERGDRRPAPPVQRYTIQFGAFGSRDNAAAAAKKLGSMVSAVRVESVEMDGRVWHRVRAGLYESKEAAESDLARVREKLGMNGAVVPLN